MAIFRHALSPAVAFTKKELSWSAKGMLAYLSFCESYRNEDSSICIESINENFGTDNVIESLKELEKKGYLRMENENFFMLF